MITKDSPRIATSKLPFFVQLMPHQKAMIHDMVIIENRLRDGARGGNNKLNYAMMSDKPGAGKTYAVLAFIYFSDKVLFKRRAVNLIVVPYNICTQWKQSMERLFGPSGTHITYKSLLDYSEMMRFYVDSKELLEYDILLTTSLYFDSLAGTLNSMGIVLKRVFFDEADTIKNLLQTPLKCLMTWFVSASMESLFGRDKKAPVNIGKYSLSMDHFLAHDVKCDPEFINENIILEPPIFQTQRIDNMYYVLLKAIVDPRYNAQISAMDYRCLRSEFVGDFDQVNSEYKACLYVMRDSRAKAENARNKLISLEKDYESLLKKEMFERAKETKKDIKWYEGVLHDSERKLSAIKYFSSQYDISEEFEERSTGGTKLENLQTILAESPKAQTILFTNHDYIYTLLQPFFEKNSISFRFLDGGNINSMDLIINAYKRREFSVLLADSSMYSCGMNLENTEHIIFIHRMEEAREKQVIGRAHRYGRDKPLKVWYLEYIE